MNPQQELELRKNAQDGTLFFCIALLLCFTVFCLVWHGRHYDYAKAKLQQEVDILRATSWPTALRESSKDWSGVFKQ